MRKLDEKLNKVYEFVVEFINSNGFPPSVRDICAFLDIKSTATAYSYLEKLKEKGLLQNSPMKKRSLTLSHKLSNGKNVPLLGTVRAGMPIFAYEDLEGYIPLPENFSSSNDQFALKINGNSMIKAGIYENDIIIVDKQNSANDGDIVVALIDDSATVKRFYKKCNKIVLHPENDDMEDLVYDDVEIIGIVKGLLRKF
ncbi:MAG: transcriptional repressor LexA [Clostridia bacterium]|nr:transcriptional repressor LexA [Clostridia bacterium]